MSKKILIIAVTLALAASGLFAGDFYFGAGIGGKVDAGSLRRDLEDVSDTGGDPWKLFVGWSLNRHLAVEVTRYDLGSQNCCRSFADFGFATEVDGFSAAAVGRWQMNKTTPFIKAGLFAWEEDGDLLTFSGNVPTSADGKDFLIGAGLDFDLSSRLTIRAEWEQLEFSGVSSDSLWASLLYRF